MMLQECDTLYDCTCATFPVKRTTYVVTLSLEMLMMLLGMADSGKYLCNTTGNSEGMAGVWTGKGGGVCVFFSSSGF